VISHKTQRGIKPGPESIASRSSGPDMHRHSLVRLFLVAAASCVSCEPESGSTAAAAAAAAAVFAEAAADWEPCSAFFCCWLLTTFNDCERGCDDPSAAWL
jgi:hypothetical protein